jgi:hypothetical protein
LRIRVVQVDGLGQIRRQVRDRVRSTADQEEFAAVVHDRWRIVAKGAVARRARTPRAAPVVSRKKVSPRGPDMKTRPCFGSRCRRGNNCNPTKFMVGVHPAPRHICGLGFVGNCVPAGGGTGLSGGGCGLPFANEPEIAICQRQGGGVPPAVIHRWLRRPQVRGGIMMQL